MRDRVENVINRNYSVWSDQCQMKKLERVDLCGIKNKRHVDEV